MGKRRSKLRAKRHRLCKSRELRRKPKYDSSEEELPDVVWDASEPDVPVASAEAEQSDDIESAAKVNPDIEAEDSDEEMAAEEFAEKMMAMFSQTPLVSAKPTQSRQPMFRPTCTPLAAPRHEGQSPKPSKEWPRRTCRAKPSKAPRRFPQAAAITVDESSSQEEMIVAEAEQSDDIESAAKVNPDIEAEDSDEEMAAEEFAEKMMAMFSQTPLVSAKPMQSRQPMVRPTCTPLAAPRHEGQSPKPSKEWPRRTCRAKPSKAPRRFPQAAAITVDESSSQEEMIVRKPSTKPLEPARLAVKALRALRSGATVVPRTSTKP
eukprot:CAMPEP_0172779456 /NCGR_PEP_ID=MMETSP1074-20121228/202430_1 /TAXON_ID=2916 /ORGANISM="Ceratium fusus, Strain PA161109" /LENGTH=319 /DNA_ID=CAMNT_0013616419 /DNA_START=45 /DNA_END=1001 /DNA_ORIENTATION=-